MSIYSKLFLRETVSPYGDFTRNSVLSFKDLDQNFIFLKERDISGVNYSSDTLTIETLGGKSFTTTISGGTGGSSIDIYNTYFVSPTGDDNTAVRGDIGKPFQTISGARNQVVAEISGGTVTGDTLIYVYPGEYTEAEIQYENGNFYFSPGVTLTTVQPSSGDSPNYLSLFNLTDTLDYASSAYTANTVNVFGKVDIDIPRRFDIPSGWGGEVLRTGDGSVCHFEFNNIFVGGGNGFKGNGDANLTIIGNEIKIDYTDYVFNFRDNSTTRVDVKKVTGGFDTFSSAIIYRDFSGKSQFHVQELFSEPSWKALSFINIYDGAEVNLTADSIRHTVYSAATDYPIEVDNMEGGIIRLNGTIDALTGGIKTTRSGGGIVEMNMDITSGLYPVTFQSSNNTTGHTFIYNGDFRINDPAVTYGAFLLGDCVNYISGSISDLSGNGIGYGIQANNPAIVNIGDLKIKDINGNVFQGSSTFNIEGNLYTEKEITGVTFNGQYQLLEKTSIDKLQIRDIQTGTSVTNLGIDSDGNVVSGSTLSTKISLTEAQVEGAFVTPVELIPAPGVGKFIDVISASVKLNYGTAPYNSAQIRVRYSNSTGTNRLLNSNNITNSTVDIINVLAQSSYEIYENDSLELVLSADPGTTGDGTLDVYITYQIVTL